MTFLLTDIEGSTRLLQQSADDFGDALAIHHGLLRDAIAAHGGVARRTEGDAFFATFDTAPDAARAAVSAQRALAVQAWPGECIVRVRMGLHTGEAVMIAEELVGLDIHRAARIAGVGWGGQILVSAVTANLLPGVDDIGLRDLGEHRLKDLAAPERLAQVVADGLEQDFPAVRSLDAVTNNLPTQLTAFIGRRREVAEVTALLDDSRLVTLTGPGGTGKTRLSLQVAAEVAGSFTDGVFFVPLAAATDASMVMSTVAAVLGLRATGHQTPLDLVIEHLQSRRALLVLDNLEQVLDAAVDISKLLGAAPDVTVLTSSRAPLRISGEQEYPVSPLPLPDPNDDLGAVASSDAVALFVSRAAAVQPGFAVTAENAASVVRITTRLDGLPLAIELAAARVKLLPVTAIADRLSQALQLLSGGARDLPDRQRTLRGAIDWSHDLLDGATRRLFARCSVFRGGVQLEHLLEVCQPDLDEDVFGLLTALVDHSLVRRLPDQTSARFAMLEVIREYAQEQLESSGEAPQVRQRHTQLYLRCAEEAAGELTGDAGGLWLDRLEGDYDNFRAALGYAVEDGDVRAALRMVAALWRMWQMRGRLHEGRRTTDRVIASPGVDEWPAELAATYEAGGGIAYWQGDLAGSRTYYERALELYRDHGDAECIARATYNLAFSFGFEYPERAAEVFREALVAYERIGSTIGIAKAHWGMGVASLWLRDYDAMREHSEECLPVFRQSGATYDLAWALHMAGLGEHARGGYTRARSLFIEALELFMKSSDTSGLYLVLVDFALLFEATGHPDRALRLLGAVNRLGQETGAGLAYPQLDLYPRKQRAEDAFDTATVEALRAEGHAMSREEAVAYALKT